MKKIISVILVIALSFSLCSCGNIKGNAKQFSSSTFDYFDTVCTVTAYDENEDSFNKHYQEIKKQLKRYNELFDIYNSYSGINNLFTVNALAGKQAVKVDKEIMELLKFGKEAYAMSGGKTNIAFGSVLKIWHEKREEGKSLPDTAELKKADEHTDINKLILDFKNNTVRFDDEKMQLDVGAIAKGFAAHRIWSYAKEKLWKSAMINLGGNVCAIGTKPDGSAWKIAIENPDEKSDDYLCTLKINNKCVITSADNQRYYTVNGKRYCHIIDPETLMPAEYFSSVSVICDFSSYGDALSTTLFNMPINDGKALLKKLGNAEAVWVTKDYKKIYSDKFKDYINEES